MVSEAPVLYRVTIGHARTRPFLRTFKHKGHYWLVDIAALPRVARPLRPLVRFEGRDHFDPDSESIGAGVEGVLKSEGIDLAGGRVLMLASSRTLGHVFNPLSLFWCYDRDERLRAVIAEVHNTYGERHNYVLHTDAVGNAVMAKDFYVSPFFEVTGNYTISAPEPDDHLKVSITLHQGGVPVFSAWVNGERLACSTTNIVRATLRHPLGGYRVSGLIRLHGIALWLRRLPVVPREDRQKVGGPR
jgi:DUF1365 family protein